MGNRRPAGFGRSGALHNKEWEVACIDFSSIDLAIGQLVAFVLFTADEAETLLRLRGEVYMELDAGATDEMATVAVGVGVVSARAAIAGTGSIPRPATDGAYPWLWHGFMNVSSGQGASVPVDLASLFDRLSVDSKAMRKLKETEVIVIVFEICESVDQTGHVSVGGGFRALAGD